jgi:hypothetical protein
LTDTELIRRCHTVFPGHRARTPAEMYAMAAWCEQHGIEHDVYGAGTLIESFEDKIAALLGFEAALFCISGTMAQVTALRLACSDRATRRARCTRLPTSSITNARTFERPDARPFRSPAGRRPESPLDRRRPSKRCRTS